MCLDYPHTLHWPLTTLTSLKWAPKSSKVSFEILEHDFNWTIDEVEHLYLYSDWYTVSGTTLANSINGTKQPDDLCYRVFYVATAGLCEKLFLISRDINLVILWFWVAHNCNKDLKIYIDNVLNSQQRLHKPLGWEGSGPVGPSGPPLRACMKHSEKYDIWLLRTVYGIDCVGTKFNCKPNLVVMNAKYVVSRDHIYLQIIIIKLGMWEKAQVLSFYDVN